MWTSTSLSFSVQCPLCTSKWKTARCCKTNIGVNMLWDRSNQLIRSKVRQVAMSALGRPGIIVNNNVNFVSGIFVDFAVHC